jgi:hypothetical protein
MVFDFVDDAGRCNQSRNLHRLIKTSRYRPGAYVLASDERIASEEARGDATPVSRKPARLAPRYPARLTAKMRRRRSSSPSLGEGRGDGTPA